MPCDISPEIKIYIFSMIILSVNFYKLTGKTYIIKKEQEIYRKHPAL